MPLAFGSAASRASLERSLKIALALAVLVALVLSLVGRQGRIEEASAVAQETAAAQSRSALPAGPEMSPAAPQPAPLAPSSLAEAPVGRALPPLATPILPPARLGGPRLDGRDPVSATALAEQMGPPAPRLRLLPRPVALDSATFQIGNGRIALVGVEPLATSAVCGKDDLAWRCGMQARTALRGWLRSRSISCSVPESFGQRDETIAARCQLGQEDIALWLVENGWARARDTSRYTIVQDKARESGLGMWRAGAPTAP